MKLRTCWLILLLGCCTLQFAWAADSGVSIVALEPWSNVFAEKKVSFRFAVRSSAPFSGKVGWRFSVGDRTITRGEAAVTSAPGKAGRVKVALEIPKVKPGVEMRTLLTLSVYGDEGGKAVSALEKALWIFGKDPFVDRSEWLKGLKLCLFDPEDKTAPILTKAKVPFKKLANVDAIGQLEAGMLLIGEGVSMGDYRGLWAEVMKLAARGRPVLCLAPAGGEVEIPGDGDALPDPRSMTFRRNDVIKSLDKRLDAGSWSSDGKVVSSTMLLRGSRSSIDGEIQKNGKGWPWVEIGFREKGKLVVCGFAIMEKWNRGPAARYLFARLLEYAGRETNKGGER